MAESEEDNSKIRLSPYTRLALTLQIEMSRDANSEYFNEQRYQSYLERYRNAVIHRDKVMRNMVMTDGLAALALFGKNIAIPFVGLSLVDIPGGLQSIILVASLGFLFVCTAFINEQFYKCAVDQFSIRKAKKLGIDPDYLTYADVHTEFFIKVFNRKMSNYTADYFIPGRGYVLFFRTLTISVTLGLLTLISLHLMLVGYAIYFSHAANGFGIASSLLSFGAVLANVIGLLIAATQLKQFDFKIDWEAERASRANSDQPSVSHE